MSKSIIFIGLVTALVLGAGAGYWYAAYMGTPSGTPAQEMQAKEEGEILFYRHPMNPEITSPVPAKDDMGMDYIPVYADGGEAKSKPAGTVSIDPVVEQNIGVRITEAQYRSLSRRIITVGRVDYNEERLTRLHPKVEGWVDTLFVDKTGAVVDRDTILLSIYSPQLVSSQEEYLLAVDNWNSLRDSPFDDIQRSARQLLTSARERLVLFDVPEHQIKELERTHKVKRDLHIHSTHPGAVINIGVREGQYVTPNTELYTIADLSKVWVYADIFEYELPWVKEGDPAEMRLAAMPGTTFHGRITYIYPYAERQTRTVKVRLEFDNPSRMLRPEMFANVTINASRQERALVIPSEAVLRTGAGEHVFVRRAPGEFTPRDVKLGLESDGWVQVTGGLEQGEAVVTSAQFLIDSESKLREAAAKMTAPMRDTGQDGARDKPMTEHGHD